MPGSATAEEVIGSGMVVFCLAKQLRLIVDEIVARGLSDQSAPPTLRQRPADVFARDAGHRGDVVLPDFMEDRDPSRLCLSAEMFGEFEQGPRDARLHGQEACGRQLFIGFAQARSECRDQIAIDFGIVAEAGSGLVHD